MARIKPKRADIRAVLGATGSGKSTFVRQLIRRMRPRRLMVWDLMNEHQEIRRAETLFALLNFWDISARGHIRFVPSHDANVRAQQFEFFCDMALRLGNLLVVVEELHFVTTAQRAPDRWALLTCTGRHHGVSIIGTSQRPAHMDKDFLGNCSHIYSFRLAHPRDAAAVAAALPATQSAELLALPDFRGTGIERGKVVVVQSIP